MRGISSVYLLCFLTNIIFVARKVNTKPLEHWPLDIIPHEGRECIPLKNCYFYLQYIGEDIPNSLRKKMAKDILEHACGLDVHRNVEKGNVK